MWLRWILCWFGHIIGGIYQGRTIIIYGGWVWVNLGVFWLTYVYSILDIMQEVFDTFLNPIMNVEGGGGF